MGLVIFKVNNTLHICITQKRFIVIGFSEHDWLQDCQCPSLVLDHQKSTYYFSNFGGHDQCALAAVSFLLQRHVDMS